MIEIDKLIKKWENINLLSIGYNCYPSLIIHKIKDEPFALFDWTGSSLYGIKKFIKDGFPVITNIEDLCIYEHYRHTNGEKIYIPTNKKYFIRFFHDFNKSINKLPDIDQDFIDKILRRNVRLQNILKDTKPLLILHLEDVNNRANNMIGDHDAHYPKNIYNEKYIEEYSKISLNEAIELSQIITTKYNSNMLLIYFSIYQTTQHIKSNNIFIINLGLDIKSYEDKGTCKIKMIKLLFKYSDILTNILNNNIVNSNIVNNNIVNSNIVNNNIVNNNIVNNNIVNNRLNNE
jgi:hypothetical protein